MRTDLTIPSARGDCWPRKPEFGGALCGRAAAARG